MIRRSLVSLIVVALVPAATVAAPATALGGTGRLGLRPSSGPPGTRISAIGAGFAAGETVGFAFDGHPVATGVAAGDGSVRAVFRAPASSLPGEHVVLDVGRTSRAMARSTFDVHTDWPQFMLDPPHTAYNPTENVITTQNVATLEEAWHADVPHGPLAPVVVNGTVYVSEGNAVSTGSIRAFPLSCGSGGATCRPLWTCCNEGFGWLLTPAVDHGRLFIARFGGLYAFNLRDCSDGSCDPLWVTGIGAYAASSVTVSNGIVYVGTCDSCEGGPNPDMVQAVDERAGDLLWTAPGGDISLSGPVVAHGSVYAGDQSAVVYSLDAGTGKQRWTGSVGSAVFGYPSVGGARLFVHSAFPGTLYAYDARGCGASKCRPLWQAPTGSIGQGSSPAVAGDLVYVAEYDGTVSAFATVGCGAPTCAPVWSWSVATSFTGAPAIANGVLYVAGNNGHLYAFDASGCGHPTCPPLVDVDAGGPSATGGISPVVVDGTVLVAGASLVALVPVPTS